MTNKKTIQVNKDFLSISNRLSKKKEAKAKKTKPKSLISPNKMKKEFLKKVKNFQEKREKHLSQNNQDKTDFYPKIIKIKLILLLTMTLIILKMNLINHLDFYKISWIQKIIPNLLLSKLIYLNL
jgi:uncharacterized protein YaiL (DUF2058 family)